MPVSDAVWDTLTRTIVFGLQFAFNWFIVQTDCLTYTYCLVLVLSIKLSESVGHLRERSDLNFKSKYRTTQKPQHGVHSAGYFLSRNCQKLNRLFTLIYDTATSCVLSCFAQRIAMWIVKPLWLNTVAVWLSVLVEACSNYIFFHVHGSHGPSYIHCLNEMCRPLLWLVIISLTMFIFIEGSMP